jgi:hypothetical protein
MNRPPVIVAALIASLVVAMVTPACASRTGDIAEDFTEDVHRICHSMCEMNLACRDPPAFETFEECFADCSGPELIYEDSECGQAFRDHFECLGNTANCEEFLDTNNVDAAEFTCMETNLTIVGLKCGAQDGED